MSKTIPVPVKVPMSLTINGIETQLSVAPWTTLLDTLRDHLGLTGTKKGCDTANAARARFCWMAGASIRVSRSPSCGTGPK
jgi:aerobic-type carbon monoxide dehydrogenase small subunit (CoxS/CutS family)